MNAVASKPRAQRAAPKPPQIEASAQIAEPVSTLASTPTATTKPFDTDAASLILQRAGSISGLLMNIFGNGAGASPREIRELTGLMGSVQHLRRLLEHLERSVTESTASGVTGDVYGLIVEAAHLAILIDETEWLAGFDFHFGDSFYCCYFDAIRAACETADLTLSTEISAKELA